jgi:hypothetical protein
VSVAAIAAALPRLHTLHASNSRRNYDFAVAEFFDDLLPRLRSFHFEGWWPEDERTAVSSSPPSPPPLPRLRDLKWMGRDDNQEWGPIALPCGFMGAEPVSLHLCLPWSATGGPFARVRDLWLGVATLKTPDLAWLLRAAPHLRRLTVKIFYRVRQDPFWLTATDPITDPAFVGLVHPWLRHLNLAVSCEHAPGVADCAFLLQQRHFPRLRRLTLNKEEYPVSMPE